MVLKIVSLKLPEEMVRALDELASERRVPRSQIIREAIAFYLLHAQGFVYCRERGWCRPGDGDGSMKGKRGDRDGRGGGCNIVEVDGVKIIKILS